MSGHLPEDQAREYWGDHAVELIAVARAAQAFIDTTAIRYSNIEKRSVPSGFTADSGQAAIALFDSLALLADAPEGEA